MHHQRNRLCRRLFAAFMLALLAVAFWLMLAAQAFSDVR